MDGRSGRDALEAPATAWIHDAAVRRWRRWLRRSDVWPSPWPPFPRSGWTPVAPPSGIALPLREFLLHVAAPVECAVPSPVPTVPRAARAAVAPDGVAAPVRITALVAIAMAAHYRPISPSNAAYVKTPPPPRERAPRDAFATLVEPEESGGRRRGVIPARET